MCVDRAPGSKIGDKCSAFCFNATVAVPTPPYLECTPHGYRVEGGSCPVYRYST